MTPAFRMQVRRTGPAAMLVLLCSAAWAQGSADCTIEPQQSAELRWAVEGIVEQVRVQRGDRVRTGQPLAQLESAAERSALQVARQRAAMSARIEMLQHRREQAERKAARVAGLHRQSFASAQAQEEAESERRIADAEWRDAQEAQQLAEQELRHAEDLLARRTLVAPFDGVVVERWLNPGELSDTSGRKAALRIAQIDPLRVEAVLPLSQFGRVRPGMSATVVPEGRGSKLSARVQLVDPMVDAASGTFGVRLSMPGGAGAPPAGIRCRLEIAGVAADTPASAPKARP